MVPKGLHWGWQVHEVVAKVGVQIGSGAILARVPGSGARAFSEGVRASNLGLESKAGARSRGSNRRERGPLVGLVEAVGILAPQG